MVCVYGMSHVPALLLLEFPGYEGKGAFLLFYLVLVVQTCMLVQHLVSRRAAVPGPATADGDAALVVAPGWLAAFRRRLFLQPPVAPNISSSFNWTSWALGMAIASIVGALFSFITPFRFWQGFLMSLIACIAGSMGHLVMKALKRDRGIPNWGPRGVVTGANGLLDRVDALCFAAPVFFHAVRWYFDV